MSRRRVVLSRRRLSQSGYAVRYSAPGSGDSEPRMKCRGDVGNGKAEAGARGSVQAGGPGGGLRGGTSEAAARGKLKLRGSSLRGEHSLRSSNSERWEEEQAKKASAQPNSVRKRK
jgi:hypothetical protein